jgi:anthranilate synthase component 1
MAATPHIRHLDEFNDLLALHRVNPERYPFLLQSTAKGFTKSSEKDSSSARYDILFAFPEETVRLENASSTSTKINPSDFFNDLDRSWKINRENKSQHASLPFSGGWFLYLAYELAGQVEPGLNLPSSDDGLPTAHAVRIPAAVIVDHVEEKTFCVVESDRENLLDSLLVDIKQAFDESSTSAMLANQVQIKLSEDDSSHYINGVSNIKQYITDGDVFQVNLSRAWKGGLSESESPANIYQRLCQKNPAPFAGLALIDGVAIISSSPERLVRVTDGLVETRPIAGTRPRSHLESEDHALQEELLAHPKERAEHIMLIDLERNDLGRVCVPGTIEVNELMGLESYAHVHHIVSNVRGQLRDDVTPGQVLRAVFPGGTITGCPKVRCMEIIAELEGEGRGAYTGSMGYLNHDGSMDMNILIRTIVQRGDLINFRAGAGIVSDSSPEHELGETRAKARGLLLALKEDAR